MACEITKRCIEIYKLGLELPLENDFYIVNVKKTALLGYKEKQIQQEKGFVLDCTNVNNSKLIRSDWHFTHDVSFSCVPACNFVFCLSLGFFFAFTIRISFTM